MKTPLRYLGGKSKAFDLITPHLFSGGYPKTIVSPFLGGGSLESRWASERYTKVLGADIFKPLVFLWQEILSDPQGLYESVSKMPVTQQEYDRVKEVLMTWEYTQEILSDWATDHYKRESTHTLTRKESAVLFLYNHGLSYGPQYLGWISSIYLKDKTKWENVLHRIKNYRNPNLSVVESSFEDTIQGHPQDVLYLDPPYFLSGDMFKGLYPNPNFAVHHNDFDHAKLRDLLHNHKGRFVLSYNDCDEIREYYKGFDFHFPEWKYSLGNGETRVGKNREERNSEKDKKSHEILIVKR